MRLRIHAEKFGQADETGRHLPLVPTLETQTNKNLSAQRKRKRLGWVQEVKVVAGVKLFRIRKRTKITWINQKDVVNDVETKKETAQGALDESARQFVQTLASETEKAMDQTNVQSQGQADAGIHPAQNGMADKSGVRVQRDGPQREADLLVFSASSRGGSSQKGASQQAVADDGILGGGLRSISSILDRQHQSSSGTGNDSAKLELTGLTCAFIHRRRHQRKRI